MDGVCSSLVFYPEKKVGREVDVKSEGVAGGKKNVNRWLRREVRSGEAGRRTPGKARPCRPGQTQPCQGGLIATDSSQATTQYII